MLARLGRYGRNRHSVWTVCALRSRGRVEVSSEDFRYLHDTMYIIILHRSHTQQHLPGCHGLREEPHHACLRQAHD